MYVYMCIHMYIYMHNIDILKKWKVKFKNLKGVKKEFSVMFNASNKSKMCYPSG